MRNFAKPEVADIYAFLAEHNALIVHFSGTPSAGDGRYVFPGDLQNVLALGAMTGVSASLVKPGDNFDAAKGPRSAYGSVGVILGLKSKQSLATATAGDGGSIFEDGVREFDEGDLDMDRVRRSLDARLDANEWGIRDYKPIGVFVHEPIEINTPGQKPNVDIEHVRKALLGQRIFTFRDRDIIELFPDGTAKTVDHSELYPMQN